ncbi:hypothetical protein L249_6532 [Ophiocordyceps polyrhachis-furcata BCC 54312]|uniref:Uncharacterized protein n=1 Tax=Ophiocordyceps polyrhachis-furcata BCC 54312 TaxID=1330021 RepID=A0A367LJN0_9HYPO|nr:hypothetical protein L249_6532 [Ophiocordyceps polyrhachis-furcata BCC 54312]
MSSSPLPPVTLPLIILHRAPDSSPSRHRRKSSATTVVFDPSADDTQPRSKHEDLFRWKPIRRRLFAPADPDLLHRLWRPRAHQPSAQEIKRRQRKKRLSNNSNNNNNNNNNNNSETIDSKHHQGQETVQVDLTPKKMDLAPKKIVALDFMTQCGAWGDEDDDDDDSENNDGLAGSDSSLSDSDSSLDGGDEGFFVGNFVDLD